MHNAASRKRVLSSLATTTGDSMIVKQMICAIGLALTMQTGLMSQETPMTLLRPDQVEFLALYKELVETNTTLSAGSCILAAERMAAYLKAAGYVDTAILEQP